MSRRYVRQADLDVIRMGLSERDESILRSLTRFHLLSGDQVQRLHFANYASGRTARRMTQLAMRRLAGLGVVDHLERRVGGVRAGSASFVWHLSAPGRRLLAQIDGQAVGRIDTLREPGQRTVDHTLAIAELGVVLHEEDRARRLELVEFAPEPASWRTYLNTGGGLSRLKPDAFVVTALPGADTESVLFVEVDRATASKAALVRKAAQYETYRRTGKEQAAQGTFPRVVWIVPDEARAERVQEAIRSSRRVDPAIHWVGTLAQFVRLVTTDDSGGDATSAGADRESGHVSDPGTPTGSAS